jgi:hypothetical protein
MAKHRVGRHRPRPGCAASNSGIFNRIPATKPAAGKKNFTQGKNCFVARAACSNVAGPDFAVTRRDAVLRRPVQLQHGAGPSRAAKGKPRPDGGDACKVNAGHVRICTRIIGCSRGLADLKSALPQQNKDRIP